MRKSERLNPEQFLTQYYYPADTATEQAVETLRIELGLQNRDSSREAVGSFLVACRGLLWRGGTLLGFPHDPKAFERFHATYASLREALIALGYIELVQGGYKDLRTGKNYVSTYRVVRFPEALEGALWFEHRQPPRLVTVREGKKRFRAETDGEDDGRVLTVSQCRERFGDEYDIQFLRLSGVAQFLEQHPLMMRGTAYKGLSRKFNNGRLDRGGRIYTGYSSLKKKMIDPETGKAFYPRQTATIDGEKVALIDISASFLCICAGMSGATIQPDEDPYSRLSFVDGKGEARDFAKVLVSAMIANDGRKARYTTEMLEDFPKVIRDYKLSVFTDAVYEAFPFLLGEVDGLEVMYVESAIMLRTIERCMLEGIPAWPLHDAVFVRVSHVDRTKAILSEEFKKTLGFLPRLTVDTDHLP